ncbi:acetate kinase [Spongiactinospora sp. TRM90649]|uniref:acetate/propionate family kinase n=1 Tax=Spongiactinospora sp. TRM90649 TaxID=3031114 RepID=UPI0023F7E65E|nr:acetate kinase [Spongiactinospora sp. TRM90649]MDF5754254.1 acetate kinase [Spongiactinospora sp. TRM90649]
MSASDLGSGRQGTVLVLNTGSSTIKYELVDVATGGRPARGIVERVGDTEPGRITHHRDGGSPYVQELRVPDHRTGLWAVLDAFKAAGPDLAAAPPAAVGHRVVHGGARFREPVLIDEHVIDAIAQLAPLAPLHLPAGLDGIRVARAAFPGLPQVAVFDTAFHHTLPEEVFTYAVPAEWRERYGVRRYGFHGTSVAYVSRRAAILLGREPDEVNLIVLHLGNGASATAVAGGRSVETSMGMTPMEGLVMGTRSGDVDPALPGYLARVAKLSARSVEEALLRDSGLLALAGAGDMRTVRRRADEGDPDARLARAVYCHRIRKYVGAYYAVLPGRVDAIVFTGGVGEHDDGVRADCLAGLERLGVAVDEGRNRAEDTSERVVSPPDAEVAVLVVPTDEEWEIAHETLALLGH